MYSGTVGRRRRASPAAAGRGAASSTACRSSSAAATARRRRPAAASGTCHRDAADRRERRAQDQPGRWLAHRQPGGDAGAKREAVEEDRRRVDVVALRTARPAPPPHRCTCHPRSARRRYGRIRGSRTGGSSAEPRKELVERVGALRRHPHVARVVAGAVHEEQRRRVRALRLEEPSLQLQPIGREDARLFVRGARRRAAPGASRRVKNTRGRIIRSDATVTPSPGT